MNQRVRKSRDRRRGDQNVGRSAFATGGHVSSQARGEEAEVRVPQRTTGDVSGDKLAGSAKASPFFKKLEEKLPEPKSKEEERRVIAKSTEKKASEKKTKEDTNQDDE